MEIDRNVFAIKCRDGAVWGISSSFNNKLARGASSRVDNEELDDAFVKASTADNIQHTLATLIWFVVKVPVLSEQITLVQPSVSTLGKFLTIAFFCAIFFVPSAKHAVITAARPSGIAATASATAILK